MKTKFFSASAAKQMCARVGARIDAFCANLADRAGAAARRLAAREDQPRSDSPFVLAVLLVAGAGTIILALFLMTLSPR